MSTWIYLQCLDHDPPLASPDEVGQHLTDLPDVRRVIANRHTLVDMIAQHDLTPDGYFTANAVRFLRHHLTCRIRIVDEYGVEHPTEEPEQ